VRDPIGYVEAIVRFPLYDGDKTDGSWTWFEYAEPGITTKGGLGVCTRQCTTVRAEVVLLSIAEESKR